MFGQCGRNMIRLPARRLSHNCWVLLQEAARKAKEEGGRKEAARKAKEDETEVSKTEEELLMYINAGATEPLRLTCWDFGGQVLCVCACVCVCKGV
jgi:hypothetical protein